MVRASVPGFFHLACVLKVHPHCSLCQNFIPVAGRIVSRGTDTPHGRFNIHLLVDNQVVPTF